jgi:hypothetical protein
MYNIRCKPEVLLLELVSSVVLEMRYVTMGDDENTTMYFTQIIKKKVKLCPRTDLEGPERVKRYNSTLS